MNSLQKKASVFLTNPYIPFAVLGILMLGFHLIFPDTATGDDVTIAGMLGDGTMMEYLVNRYNTWSSRMLMEILVYIVGRTPIIWRITNPMVMVIAAYSISKVFTRGNSFNKNTLICILLFMYPLVDFTSAGWMATSVSYLWPMAFGITAVIPVRKMIYNDKIKLYELPVYVVSIFIACCTEQGTAIMFGVFTIFIVMALINKRFKYLWLMVFEWVISVCGLLVVFSCPGNANRREIEMRWLPEYETFTIFDKLEHGFSATLTRFILEPNFVVLTFCLLLAVVTFIKNKNQILKLMSLIPLLCSLVFGPLRSIIAYSSPYLYDILEQMHEYAETGRFSSRCEYMYAHGIIVLDAFMALICLDILIVVYNAFKDKKLSWLSIFIILLGFAARMAICLSPTLYASGSRTAICLYYSFICCAVLLYGEFSKTADSSLKQKYYIPSLAGLMFAAGLSYLNGLFLNLPVK